jgi:hypothetical protein
MAGTGHKLWATGDLISAAAFNTYIQDQVVGVYADSSARDAAFGGGGEPTLAEGLVAFLKDTNILTVYSGSAWIEVLDIDLFNTSNIELNKDSGSAYIKLTSAHDTEATTPFLTFRKADGTVASPALVDDNAVLGTLSFQGYDGNSYATGARIKAVADGTPADGDMPTELIFQVTPDGGSETPVTALTIRPSGESRFTADQDTTDFTSADPGIVSLFNTDGAVDDFTNLDWIGNGVQPAARIGLKYTGGGAQIHMGVSNTYGSGITHTCLTLSGTGNVAVAGALSKGSGTFDIPHPTREEPWRLRHSFIEGPKADLIYRGTTTIPSSGSTTVDLDAESGMTDGTWEALNQDPWSMVSSSGHAVEWSFAGKTLTITGPADAVCQWMVIGERKDQVVLDWDATDDDGHLITEYDSSIEDDNDAGA